MNLAGTFVVVCSDLTRIETCRKDVRGSEEDSVRSWIMRSRVVWFDLSNADLDPIKVILPPSSILDEVELLSWTLRKSYRCRI